MREASAAVLPGFLMPQLQRAAAFQQGQGLYQGKRRDRISGCRAFSHSAAIRIEYKDNSNTVSLIKTYCRSCGAPITFGTLCPKCLRAQNISGHSTGTKDEESHMRYLDKSVRNKNKE